MFKSSRASNVEEYLANVPSNRQEMINFLHNFIQKSAPSLKSHFAHNMLGYGSFPYKNYKREIIQWPVVALANQKNYVSIYICALDNKQYLAEKYKKELGKVDVGKSCIRIKKLNHVDLSVLKKMIKEAAKNPGLT